MTITQIIAQTRVERAKAAAQLRTLDEALAALTKLTSASASAPKPARGRMWTPEQRAQLSAIMKKRFAQGKKKAKA
ncbi:MAG TPA: hypothetical protein VHV29_21130 [Terriglobales bacterium]|jgi:hypothetical protein|nr:hypothetical protein [Terriglobales bacterium]